LSSKTPTLLENGRHGERALQLPCFSLEVGCCRLFGDLYFNLVCIYIIYNEWMYVYDANVCTCVLGSSYSKDRFGPLHDGGFLPSQKGLLLSQ